MEQRNEIFNKPAPPSALPTAKTSASIYNQQRKNLKKNLVIQGKVKTTENLSVELPFNISMLLSIPPMLSPIKECQNLVRNPFYKPKFQMQTTDSEMKTFIEIFARNIENFAKGIDSYEQMNIPDHEEFEDIFIGKKRRSNCNYNFNTKRQKLDKF